MINGKGRVQLTVVYWIEFLVGDINECRLVRAARELAYMSHEIIHTRWTPVEEVCS